MDIYYIAIFFILGLFMGSFFNVVGDRLPRGLSIVKPRSHCPKCMHTLGALELIPVLSYLFQKGKCKSCNCKVPIIHPLFEIFTGIIYAITYYQFKLTPELIIPLFFVSMLLIILVSDMTYMIINDEVLLFTNISIIITNIILIGYKGTINYILSGILAFISMYIIKIIGDFAFKKESMGGGDVKLMFTFGLVLGYPLAMLSIFIGSLVGFPIALITLKSKKQREVPFGPLLSVGAIVLLYLKMDITTIINILIK